MGSVMGRGGVTVFLKGGFGRVEVGDLETWRLNEKARLPAFNICVEFRSSSRACFFLDVQTGRPPKS